MKQGTCNACGSRRDIHRSDAARDALTSIGASGLWGGGGGCSGAKSWTILGGGAGVSKSSGGMEGSFSSLAGGGRGFEGRSGRAMGSRGTVAGKERGCARAGRTRADESRKSEESASGRERARVSTLIRARWQPAGRRQARRPPAYLSLVAPTLLSMAEHVPTAQPVTCPDAIQWAAARRVPARSASSFLPPSPAGAV